MKAFKMYNETEKRFTHLVVAENEKRASELINGLTPKYPQEMKNSPEMVSDRSKSNIYLYHYGIYSVWACNKKEGECKSNFYVTKDGGFFGEYDTLGAATMDAKQMNERNFKF